MNALKRFGIKNAIHFHLKKWDKTVANPKYYQGKIFAKLIKENQQTVFGKDHSFKKIKNYEEFKKAVPLRTYEQLLPYLNQITAENTNILTAEKPRYFAKTAGTTAHSKYIPVTNSTATTFTKGGINTMFSYISQSKKYDILLKPRLIIQGSPKLNDRNGIMTGRMSGINYYLQPSWAKSSNLPSYEANILEVWEEKVRQTVLETKDLDLNVIGGIPPWIMMYFDTLSEETGQKFIKDIFPNLEVYFHGGLNFEPYRPIITDKIGKLVDTINIYSASEGFFGFQNDVNDKAMILATDSGIFYEFIEVEDYKNGNHHKRLQLSEVETGKDYAFILNTSSGLWGYLLGDTIRFTSTSPYKFLMTGRVNQFVSMFTEHLIEEEAHKALEYAKTVHNFEVSEVTIAPKLLSQKHKSHHEWWIEFKNEPTNLEAIAKTINQKICDQNFYYKDLIDGNVLSTLKIIPVSPKGFNSCFSALNMIDGQTKIPVLANSRKWVKPLEDYRFEYI